VSQDPAELKTRVEQLLRDAHLHRMRRHLGAAEALCREALELEPDDPQGLEMLGDLLAEDEKLDEALERYRRAFEQQPQKAILEEKIARVVLRKGEEEHERIAALLALETPRRKGEGQRNALIAVLLASVMPGAGQVFLGQRGKGIAICVLGLLPLIFGINDLFKFFLGMAGLLPKHAPPPNEFLVVLGFVGVAVWLYGLLDTSAQAAKAAKRA